MQSSFITKTDDDQKFLIVNFQNLINYGTIH